MPRSTRSDRERERERERGALCLWLLSVLSPAISRAKPPNLGRIPWLFSGEHLPIESSRIFIIFDIHWFNNFVDEEFISEEYSWRVQADVEVVIQCRDRSNTQIYVSYVNCSRVIFYKISTSSLFNDCKTWTRWNKSLRRNKEHKHLFIEESLKLAHFDFVWYGLVWFDLVWCDSTISPTKNTDWRWSYHQCRHQSTTPIISYINSYVTF